MIRLVRRKALLLLVLSLLISKDSTETLLGKVVGVTDGDTITLVINNNQEKVRLEGIDCPERGQVFGKRAKQFTSDMVYGKTVSLKRTGNDRYGRTLGLIQVQGKILNQELVKAGFAWHFKKYSSSPVLSLFEEEARQKRRGLWIEDNPLPPWDYRKLPRNKYMLIGSHYNKQETVPSKTSGDKQGLIFRGNVKSHKFHKPDCSSYTCKNCIKEFSSIEEAISHGYEPCKICMP